MQTVEIHVNTNDDIIINDILKIHSIESPGETRSTINGFKRLTN